MQAFALMDMNMEILRWSDGVRSTQTVNSYSAGGRLVTYSEIREILKFTNFMARFQDYSSDDTRCLLIPERVRRRRF